MTQLRNHLRPVDEVGYGPRRRHDGVTTRGWTRVKKNLVQRALVGASVCAITVVGLGAGSASAGEITGNGKPVPSSTTVVVDGETFTILKGNSICAYSGLNDGAEAEGVRVQTYGTDKKLMEIPKGFPGIACNGAKGFLAGGGE